MPGFGGTVGVFLENNMADFIDVTPDVQRRIQLGSLFILFDDVVKQIPEFMEIFCIFGNIVQTDNGVFKGDTGELFVVLSKEQGTHLNGKSDAVAYDVLMGHQLFHKGQVMLLQMVLFSGDDDRNITFRAVDELHLGMHMARVVSCGTDINKIGGVRYKQLLIDHDAFPLFLGKSLWLHVPTRIVLNATFAVNGFHRAKKFLGNFPEKQCYF
jgi:hypothetical protein